MFGCPVVRFGEVARLLRINWPGNHFVDAGCVRRFGATPAKQAFDGFRLGRKEVSAGKGKGAFRWQRFEKGQGLHVDFVPVPTGTLKSVPLWPVVSVFCAGARRDARMIPHMVNVIGSSHARADGVGRIAMKKDETGMRKVPSQIRGDICHAIRALGKEVPVLQSLGHLLFARMCFEAGFQVGARK